MPYVPGDAPTNYTPIRNLHYWVQLVTPLVYDDSISLYELVGKCVYKLNEVIDVVNPLGAGIEDTIQKALDAYKQEWEAELQKFQQNILNIITENNVTLNNRIDELTEDVNKQIKDATDDLNAKLAEFQAKVTADIAQVAASVETTDQANREWTLGIFQELIDRLPDQLPPVIDPTDGLLESVQTALNHMWDAWRENALTADEYDALELTATAYDEKELTAIAYDRYGKILLTETNAVYSSGVPLRKSSVNLTELNKQVGMSLSEYLA